MPALGHEEVQPATVEQLLRTLRIRAHFLALHIGQHLGGQSARKGAPRMPPNAPGFLRYVSAGSGKTIDPLIPDSPRYCGSYRQVSGGGDGAQGRSRTTDTTIFNRLLYH